ncbi:hypothetical protein CYMTET_49631 [Cymbomonas tetramitiformis]|uniref:Uncharacterized protein n=1 Tax=Cymbomonas tetramitiformis TaxID=36881 RepID=A0AAE0ETY2_9CHLO|nr:hypothetical protein CYMTET_49631 [Cymbomonas tetramitiformis]
MRLHSDRLNLLFIANSLYSLPVLLNFLKAHTKYSFRDVGGKRGWKPSDNRICDSRHATDELLDQLLPITATEGEGGHEFCPERLFQLLLPAYFYKLKEARYPIQDGYEPREEEVQKILADLGEWDVFFDARSNRIGGQLSFTSFVLSPKIEGCQDEWQFPKSTRTICEIEGQDSKQNLDANCNELFDSLQFLEDDKSVQIAVEGQIQEVHLKFVFPADMTSHWAMFKCGGHVNGPTFLFCHRCMCTYGEMAQTFDVYDVQRHDTLQSIRCSCTWD